MAKRQFRVPPRTWQGALEEFVRKVALPVFTGVMRGKLNCTYDVTLAVSPATSTTLSTEVATADSIALLTPKTASAATAVGAGVIRATCADDGTVTINHDASAAADRVFGVAILG